MRIAPRLCVLTSTDELTAALQGLTLVNLVQMRRRSFPRLYESGIVYSRERRDETGKPAENWLTADYLIQLMRGDCEDLGCYLAAEYQMRGVNALAFAKQVSPHMVHILVRLPNGTIEDPSARLGMRGDG